MLSLSLLFMCYALPQRLNLCAIVAMKVTAKLFDKTAKSLQWRDRSLNCARDVMVAGATVADAAKTHNMSEAQVRTHVWRMQQKIRDAQPIKVTADDFLDSQKQLAVFDGELDKLEEAGATEDLMVNFLERNNVSVTAAELRFYMQRRERRR